MPIRLTQEQNYQKFAPSCKNCKHFCDTRTYGGVEGMEADVCHLYGEDEPQILIAPWGICDSHERKQRR